MRVKSLKSGTTVAARKIWAGVLAAGAGTPATTEQGYTFQGADWLHVYVDYLTGATAATVIVWYYSEIAEKWFLGDTLSFTSTDKMAMIEVRGEHRVYFQVSSITGGGGTLDLWAGYSFDNKVDE